jgi:hypothetical protein
MQPGFAPSNVLGTERSIYIGHADTMQSGTSWYVCDQQRLLWKEERK